MDLVVGRIGKAHGVRGEVSVEVRTDDPDRRFAEGATLRTDPDRGELTVLRTREHHGRLLIAFDGIIDRTGAEAWRGTLLVVDSATVAATEEDEWWDHQLLDLAVVTLNGEPVGLVEDVIHVPGSSLLSVRRGDGSEVLVPFVSAIVPEVDLDAGRLVIDPPPGLLDELPDPPAEA